MCLLVFFFSFDHIVAELKFFFLLALVVYLFAQLVELVGLHSVSTVDLVAGHLDLLLILLLFLLEVLYSILDRLLLVLDLFDGSAPRHVA